MRLKFKSLCVSLSAVAALSACQDKTTPPQTIDPLAIVQSLSADELGGRLTGSTGNALARAYIVDQFKALGLTPFGADFVHPFDAKLYSEFDEDAPPVDVTAYNILATIPGKTDDIIVIGAHYDHVGINGEDIYNGADDNASGIAGLLATAAHFKKHPPEHTLIIAAWDAEESGLQGPKNFLSQSYVDESKIKLNINLDMIGYNEDNTIFVAGTYHTPALIPLVEDIASKASITVKMGHDQPENAAGDDWSNASDHGPFHKAAIPFIYFGVEDHPHYHKPTDTYENLTKDFFIKSVNTVIMAAELFDENLDAALKAGE